MFFVLFPVDVSNFAQESRKAEFVSSLFLTNSAFSQICSCIRPFSPNTTHLFFSYKNYDFDLYAIGYYTLAYKTSRLYL